MLWLGAPVHVGPLDACVCAPQLACVAASLSSRANACGSWNVMKTRSMPCARLASDWNRRHAHTGGATAHPLGFQPCATPPSRAPKRNCAQLALEELEGRKRCTCRKQPASGMRVAPAISRGRGGGVSTCQADACAEESLASLATCLPHVVSRTLGLENQFMNEEELARSRAAARGPNTPLTWAKAPR